jgi:hypothetical protein
MHSNFENLLQQAQGEWVYFLGDDDAMMPHAADYLYYITTKFPACEAVVTPRAYYFWESARDISGGFVVNVSSNEKEVWKDSKRLLADLLNAKATYFFAPQNYSGGFHRRSLIRRVYNAQNGIFYKSVMPDAYSALMGCIHTYRFLETGFPVAWVGTSDCRLKSRKPKSESSVKNWDLDFSGLHREDDLIIHRALGDLKNFTLPLVFYESYLSAFPTTSYTELNRDRLLLLLADAKKKFFHQDREEEFISLLGYLGVKMVELDQPIRMVKREEFFARNRERIYRYSKKLTDLFRPSGTRQVPWSRSLQSSSYEDYPNILNANTWAMSMFEEFMSSPTVCNA